MLQNFSQGVVVVLGKPELPGYMRDMEIKHALSRSTDRKSAKSTEMGDDLKVRPNDDR